MNTLKTIWKIIKLPFIAIAWIISLFAPAVAERNPFNEAYFTNLLVESHGFMEGNTLPNKLRPDLYRDDFVIEVDWTTKKYEAIGQALVYSHFTGKKPAIVFLADKPMDVRMISVLESLEIHYWVVQINKDEGKILSIAYN